MTWFDDLIGELVDDGYCRIDPDGALMKPGCPNRLIVKALQVGPEPDAELWHRIKVGLLATMEQPRLFAGLPIERPQDRKFRRPLWWT